MSGPADTWVTRAVVACDGASVPADVRRRGWDVVPVNSGGQDGELNLRADNLGARYLGRLDERATDLVRVAAYAFAADQMVSRGGKGDPHRRRWRRELALCAPVADPVFWNDKDTTTALSEALGFGTEDRWEFAFSPSPPDVRRLQMGFAVDARDILADPDCVALFSGGIDSLCATVEALAAHGRRPVLVSHRSTPPVAAPQRRLVGDLQAQFPDWPFPHLSFWIHKRRQEAVERTRRTRGFLVAALGAAVAGQARLPTVLLPDNGYVSVNPAVNAQLVGTLNSRGTHPTFLRLVNRLLDLVFPFGIRVENPLEGRTRAEALAVLRGFGCERLLPETRSCSRSRFEEATPHCGVCSQCVDRRFATVAAGLEAFDPPERYKVEVFTAPLPPGEARVFATSYVAHAYRADNLSAEALFDEYPELVAALDLDGGSVAASAEALAGVLKRHADEVRRVVGTMIARHSNAIAQRTLPESSLLAITLGSAATEVHGASETIAADAPAEELSPAAPSHVQNPLLQRAGKGWLITFESEKALIPGSDGMSRLVRLLKAPGQRLSALDLVAGSSPSAKPGKRRGVRDAPLDEGMNATGDLGEIIDDVAREQYRQRAHELKVELADAMASKDEERCLAIRAELESIEHELTATAGKGGKARRFSETQERARQTVWHTVKAALSVIEEEMPALGLHLRKSLKFGHYPSYDPQPRLTWDITT